MACFIVPAAGAVVTKVAEKVVSKEETKKTVTEDHEREEFHVPFSKKLSWLSYMLLGGSFLLMFEHIWHGEVTAFFPFLTAMSDKEDMYAMFREMATVGVAMLLLVTFIWAIICVVTSRIEKRAAKEAA